jgi:hypothetical protein
VEAVNPRVALKPMQFLDITTSLIKHSSDGARIRAKADNYSHETLEKTRNIIFIFV